MYRLLVAKRKTPPPIYKTLYDKHPISRLINKAEILQDERLSRESGSLEKATNAYLDRRGRRPPPNFHIWFKFAQARNAIVVEDFWDAIYKDLLPFWAMDTSKIRQQAARMSNLRIRNGKILRFGTHPSMLQTANMVRSFVRHLPDLDLSINVLEDVRVLLDYKTLGDYKILETRLRAKSKLIPDEEISDKFSGNSTEEPNTSKGTVATAATRGWSILTPASERPLWSLLFSACPANSEAYKLSKQWESTLQHDTQQLLSNPMASLDYIPMLSRPFYQDGYVKNLTEYTELCAQPDIRFLHDALMHSNVSGYYSDLVPLFATNKLSMSHEIRLPLPDSQFKAAIVSNEQLSWHEMDDSVFWSDHPSRAISNANWRGSHAHRFVSMTDPRQLKKYGNGKSSHNWFVPEIAEYTRKKGSKKSSSPSLSKRSLSFFSKYMKIGFASRSCEMGSTEHNCDFADQFTIMKDSSHIEPFRHRYLVNLDGDLDSRNFTAHLLTDSVPIRATIFRSWFDDRLVPWLHYVPMSNTFIEFYNIMEYFLGYKGVSGRDLVAKQIGKSGKHWAQKVLRSEDMEIYLFRLLLEYARVTNDDRDRLAWIMPEEGKEDEEEDDEDEG